MNTEAGERQLCRNCTRTVIYASARKRWIHQDTRDVWCKNTGTYYAEPDLSVNDRTETTDGEGSDDV